MMCNNRVPMFRTTLIREELDSMVLALSYPTSLLMDRKAAALQHAK